MSAVNPESSSTSATEGPASGPPSRLNVLVTAFGTAGDVFPPLAVAAEMKSRGHDVTFIANAHFARPVQAAGVTFVASGEESEYRSLLEARALWAPGEGLKTMMDRGAAPAMRRTYAAIAQRHEPGRTLVIGSSWAFAARVAQDKLGVPTATMHISPGNIVTAYPDRGIFHPLYSRLPLGWRRRIIRWAEKRYFDPVLAPPINALRQELGLPPVGQIQSTWLHSPQMVINAFPDWFAAPRPDWPPQARCTAFILFDGSADAELPRELEQFLDAGEPPIAVVTSSAVVTKGRGFLRESLSAAGALRRRAVFICPRREMLPPLPPWAIWCAFAPYRKLFQRCAAVIHQGALGTAALAMEAGLPQLAVPYAPEQAHNAARLRNLHIAPMVRPGRYAAPLVTRMLRVLMAEQRRPILDDFARRVRTARPLEEIALRLETLAAQPPISDAASPPQRDGKPLQALE